MNERLTTKEAALAWLYRDELHNLMSIDLLERDLASIAYAGKSSLLLRDDETFLIHCKLEPEWPELMSVLLKHLDPDRWYILKAHEDWYLADLIAQTGFTEVAEYYNGIYPPELELDAPLPPGLDIRPLTLEQLRFVRSLYKTVDDDGYIRERIADGMLGAWYHGEIAGFIGTHGNGTMGLLEVLPKYRRLGIAKALEAELIRKLRKQGRRTFGNIDKDNLLSMTVHQKIGVVVSAEPVYWLFRPEE